MTEDDARAVLLLQAVEAQPAGALWTAEDRLWATRAAAQELPADAPREARLVARARLAMQRLAPRDADAAARCWRTRLWRPGLAARGAAARPVARRRVRRLVAGPYFNLLAPLFWGLLAWNLALYALLAVAALRARATGPLRRALARWLQRRLRRTRGRGPLRLTSPRAGPGRATPLTGARAAQRCCTLLAAGLALGLIAGLLLRGLVFDYRAGWATTLLRHRDRARRARRRAGPRARAQRPAAARRAPPSTRCA